MHTAVRHVRRRPAGPVFVDRSGRRRRLMKVAGAALASILIASIGLLLAAMSGTSPLRVPGFPERSPAANADATTPSPSATAPSANPRSGGGSGGTAGAPTPTTAAATPANTRRHVPTHTPSHPKKSN